MTARQGKILVIRGGAIGDFILTLPAISALRQRYPNVHLEVLGYPHIAQLAVAGGLVDRVQPIEARALAGFFARGGELAEDLRDYFSEFDVILSYLYDPDGIFHDNVARCSMAQFIEGPHRASEGEKIHATKVYLKPLEHLAIFDADPMPRLVVGQASRLSGGRGDSQDAQITIALHPGSGSGRKNWPEPQWRDLIALLIGKTERHLLVVGGEAEGDRLEGLVTPLPCDRFTLARSLPLVELAALLQGCAAFVGHDSGITHLAAALGLPCVVLWGDTVEEIWRPQGKKMVLVREKAGLSGIMAERVFRELEEIFAIKQEQRRT